MAGCDKKNLVPSRSLVTRDLGTRFGQITRARDKAREGAGDRKAREKIAMRFVCSVDFASRSISMFFIFMHVPNV